MCELKSYCLIIKLTWPTEEFPLRHVLKVRTPAYVCVFDDSTVFPSVALGAGRRCRAVSEEGNDGEFLDPDRDCKEVAVYPCWSSNGFNDNFTD